LKSPWSSGMVSAMQQRVVTTPDIVRAALCLHDATCCAL
jgi:hypothetical protein